MSGFQRDYILRVIEEMSQFLISLFIADRNADPAQKQAAIEQRLRMLTGHEPVQFQSTPLSKLMADMQQRNDITQEVSNDDWWVMVAMLAEETAEMQLEHSQTAIADRYFEIARLAVAKVPNIVEILTNSYVVANQIQEAEISLPASVMRLFWFHYEQIADFANAEDWLFTLIQTYPLKTDVLAQGIEFYTRLLDHTSSELTAGGLPRAEVYEGLAELRVLQYRRVTSMQG